MANTFENEIAKSFRVPEEGFPAPLKNRFEYIKLVVNKQGHYGIKSPCDALVDVYDHPGLALELKEQQQKLGFSFARVEQHQIDGLLRFQALGRKSYVLICFRHWKLLEKEMVGLKPIEKRNAQQRKAFAFPIDDFLNLVEEEKLKGKSSLSIAIIEKNGILLKPLRLKSNESTSSYNIWEITSLL